MSNEHTFQCQGCAKCCTNLIIDDEAGLLLLPEETHYFPADMISPCQAVGSYPGDSKFTIITYQLNRNICPKLNDNKCTIYENRPITCRSFPVIDSSTRPGLDVAGECTEVKEIIEKYGRGVRTNIPQGYGEAHEVLRIRTNPFYLLPNLSFKRWVYNLKIKGWELYKKN